jgi:hypothetical protein
MNIKDNYLLNLFLRPARPRSPGARRRSECGKPALSSILKNMRYFYSPSILI